MKVRKYRAKTAPMFLGVIDGVKKYSESKWVYGYYAPCYLFEKDGEVKNSYCIIRDESIEKLEMLGCGVQSGTPAKYAIIEETLGQSTGLKDKNGIEIFEGDIFEVEGEGCFVVQWSGAGYFELQFYGYYEKSLDGNAYETVWDKLDCEPIWNWDIEKMEIKGNIFDNPNLIKGEQNET